MAGTPVVIIGTPEYKIESRALALARGKSSFVVSYRDWAAAHGYARATPGDARNVPRNANLATRTRNAIRTRLAGLRTDWNGECWYVGHSQGAGSVYIGGYTTFTRNPNFAKPVDGAAYAAFLGDILPRPTGGALHLPLLACWLGDPKETAAMRFLAAVLEPLSSAMTGVRVFAYATKFETWYGGFDFVSINGIRRGGFDSGVDTRVLFEKLRNEAMSDPHAMKGRFNLYADDEFRVQADAKQRPRDDRDAEFTTLADILTKDYRSAAAKYAGQNVAKRAFTTFFWERSSRRLARDKSNTLSTQGAATAPIEYP
jgi:hypothetical protein